VVVVEVEVVLDVDLVLDVVEDVVDVVVLEDVVELDWEDGAATALTLGFPSLPRPPALKTVMIAVFPGGTVTTQKSPPPAPLA
jgi:hypothetical protein